MEVSSPNNLPDGVQESDLYDGPQVPTPGKVVPMPGSSPKAVADLVRQIPRDRDLSPRDPPPQVSPSVEDQTGYAETINLALDILSARLLGLVALVTACLIWAFVIYDPNYLRIMAAGAFSISVFLPIMIIYWRAGMTGEGG